MNNAWIYSLSAAMYGMAALLASFIWIIHEERKAKRNAFRYFWEEIERQ
jgi:hypothetical protein